MEEIWKAIPGYEGYYEVSDQGNVRSLDRKVGSMFFKGKVLKQNINKGYYRLELSHKSKGTTFQTHQLVAMAFLNHKPCGFKGFVVDHIDNNPLNNNLSNLQLISHRENSSKDVKNKTSLFTGVSFIKSKNKWSSNIHFNGKKKHLGYFTSEIEASEYYQNALKSIENGTEIKVKKHKKTSKYIGVSWYKQISKWQAQTTINGKNKFLGYFNCETAAHFAVLKEKSLYLHKN